MTRRAARSATPVPAPRYDRHALLGATDLRLLADELLGYHVGRGRSMKWPSPVPGHPQTGKSPPMSIFRSRDGIERWKCFATGETGTAIDLVMTVNGCDCRDAIELLAERASLPPEHQPVAWALPTRAPAAPVDAERPTRVRARTEAYVAACARLLWAPDAQPALDWLIENRGLAPEILRANRVGYDPGPDALARPPGLPRLGPGVVFPALRDDGRAIYFQTRYLDLATTGRKYDNPAAWVAPNPKITSIRLPDGQPPVRPQLVVTEGLPDALAVASAGVRAAAVLGTGNASREVATTLAAEPSALVIAFDADDAGRRAAKQLLEALATAGRTTGVSVITPPEPFTDLNDWLRPTPPRHTNNLGLIA